MSRKFAHLSELCSHTEALNGWLPKAFRAVEVIERALCVDHRVRPVQIIDATAHLEGDIFTGEEEKGNEVAFIFVDDDYISSPLDCKLE